ncbi:DUF1015 domain-containing protein [Candidatus Magnetominusculus xianensis]|uniref:DUF1015 domain-containing protein n=1 Tax=Candidatus Magnetominusculus xianensis TaxID=1748249 RepID=A0ABR5SJJ8_9BACT|nr:DUF1015 domain-containing protein [Candidatus Magnetominusculus xianensis]KWT85548.1 hypothetical protein ASN18_1682 [Candidatus Magnetominusculus xianensis]MBF0404221.1 DUF1015 domain-containing protein [Nitrospirota bacterium]
MTKAIPFKGLLYDPEKVFMYDVTAPPYDIITGDMLQRLYERGPYNIARVDCGMETSPDGGNLTKYLLASESLRKWIEEGIIKFGDRPAYYLYETVYTADNKKKTMYGIFAAVKLAEPGKGIYPHEMTHSKPKEDRFNLLRICRANTSPIFSIYDNPDLKTTEVLRSVLNERPYIEFTDDDSVAHKCWIVSDSKHIETIQDGLTGRDIFIADGHHRYETALKYQKLMKEGSGDSDAAYNYVLMLLVNVADAGITIKPTHRLLSNLPANALELLQEQFDVTSLPPGTDIIGAIANKQHTFGMLLKGGKFYTLHYKGEIPPGVLAIDVIILHEIIFKKLYNVTEFGYEMDVAKTIAKVESGQEGKQYEAAFFLNPTRVEDIELVARAGLRMPPKSTYFYPKIPTGIVINYFDK